MPSSTSVASLFLTGLALAGCSDRVGSPVTAPSQHHLASHVQQSVTGHAEFTSPVTGTFARYSFSAVRHADGTVTGEYQEHRETAAGVQTKVHAAVTCFAIVGNRARVGGTIDRVDPPLPPGITDGFLTVEDNGEGAGGGEQPADRGTGG